MAKFVRRDGFRTDSYGYIKFEINKTKDDSRKRFHQHNKQIKKKKKK